MARKRRRSSRRSAPVGSPATSTAAGATAGGATAGGAPRTKASGKGAWKVMDRSTSIVAGLLATRASNVAWRVVTGRKPPTSGRHPDVSTTEAVAWAAVGGALVEMVRVAVRRSAATYWVKSTGQLPPGMKPLATDPKRGGSNAPGTTKEPSPVGPAPRTSRRKKRLSRRSRGR